MSTRRRRNIYGQNLRACRKGKSTDLGGSWDPQGKCTELGGGVHQICFDLNQDTKNFSEETYQSNWSDSRQGKSHCMCLGAWALYKARQGKGEIQHTDDELICDAIPESVFDPEYVDIWSTWNGHQLENQIHNGIDSLYQQCRRKSRNKSQKKYLDKKYRKLKEHLS